MKLYLASQSPRRAQLLQQIGVEFTKQAVDIDEEPLPNEPVEDYLQRMAQDKAEAAQQELGLAGVNIDSSLILTADTTIDLDGEIIAKPENEEDCVAILNQLSGRAHNVMTGVCLLLGDTCRYCMVKPQVNFRELSENEIRRYWMTGEPQDKAGSYGIQGLGSVFVDSIHGSYSNVVGLPLTETAELLSEFGIAIWQQRLNG